MVEITGALPLYGRVECRGTMADPLQFSNQTSSNSFSFKHQEYCFIEVLYGPEIIPLCTDQKCHNFYRVYCNFWTIYGGFTFFLNTLGKQITSRRTSEKGPILKAGPTEKFLIVDHLKEGLNEPEFKC